MVQGFVAAGFEPVLDTLQETVGRPEECGAGVAAWLDGTPVVDLWTGAAARARPWRRETLVTVFSVTKAATALVAQLLASRGDLELDRPVAHYWPEFAAEGKGRATVRHVLTHTVGLPWFPNYWELVSFDDDGGWGETDEITARLAAAPLIWEPGRRVGYHAITYGWLVAEIVRRVDGRTLGQVFHDEVARPLELEFWIGLPEQCEPLLATLVGETLEYPAALVGQPVTDPADLALFIGPQRRSPTATANSREFRMAEVPAVNGIATARAIAKMYGMLAVGGTLDGVSLLTRESIVDYSREQVRGADAIFPVEARLGLGYGLPSPRGMNFGRGGDGAFGFQGLGGSLGFADLERGLGFGYATNDLRAGDETDPRARALAQSVYSCVDRAA